jgi:hypothetical protein
MAIIFTVLPLLLKLEIFKFAFTFKAKIKFGHGYGEMQENLLFEFYAGLGTNKFITLVK